MLPPAISSITRCGGPRVDFAELDAVAAQTRATVPLDLESSASPEATSARTSSRCRIDQLVDPGLADLLNEDTGARGQLLLTALDLALTAAELLKSMKVSPGDHVGRVGLQARGIGVDRLLDVAELKLRLAEPIERGGVPRRPLDNQLIDRQGVFPSTLDGRKTGIVDQLAPGRLLRFIHAEVSFPLTSSAGVVFDQAVAPSTVPIKYQGEDSVIRTCTFCPSKSRSESTWTSRLPRVRPVQRPFCRESIRTS